MPNAPDITTQAETAAEALQQRIDLFVNHLQQNGFEVLPAQMGAIEYILLRQMTEGNLEDTEQLRNNLCPVVARDERQQKLFTRNFTTWFPPVSDNENKPQEIREKPQKRKSRRDRHGIIIFSLLALFIVSFVISINTEQKAVPVTGTVPGKAKVIKELPTGKIIEEPQQYITINKKVPHPVVLPLRIALTAIPFLIFLLWLFNRWKKRIMWLSHAPVERALTERQYADNANDNLFSNLFQNADFQNAGRRLHRYREENTNDLDIQKTVLKTVAAAGYFTPVYRKRKFSPDYLFLIEQKDRNDHMARMVDVAITRFRDKNIHVERYYYRTDLRRLVHDDEERTVANLEDLSEKLQNHRMVIVGTADGLFHPLTGEIRSWADVFNHWETRTLLSARPLNEWTEDHEIRLLESGFSLATASVKGISAFAKGVSSAEIDRGGVLLQGRITSVNPLQTIDNQTSKAHNISIFRDTNFAPEMVNIPMGSFLMGSPKNEKGRSRNEGPQHSVVLNYSLSVSRFAITFDEWDFFIKNSGYQNRADDWGWGRGRRPVINVNWSDVQAYLSWLSYETGHRYRLLSEAEWEYCCRAGTKTLYWWGNEINSERANYNKNICKTVPVDYYESNPWGLYQMHGNVLEWCQDQWHDNYDRAPTDGSAWLQSSPKGNFPVLRGGSWLIMPQGLRSAARIKSGNPSNRSISVGFRVARSSFLVS